VFKWVEFTDKERNEDFFKALKLEPLTDKDVRLNEKDLEGDECEIEMRTNLVVTLLMSCGYCYAHLFFFDEARKCFDFAIELAPIASDAYLRRSQCIMYDKDSDMTALRQAVDDANKALERRPKDKFYNQHKQELEQVVQNYIGNKILFVREMVAKAES
jgi:tetratricopeptide (TPR) repeat protein